MTTNADRGPLPPLALAAAAAGLLGAGFALGLLYGSGDAPDTALTPLPIDPGAPVAVAHDPALANEIRELQDAVTDLRHDLATRPAAMPSLGAADAVPASAERVPVEGTAGSEDAWRDLLQRLHRIETLQRQQLTAAGLDLSIPPGVGIREFLGALKNSSSSDDVQRAHHMWTYARTQATYGPPDQIDEHEDYIEWIYKLGEEEQFDFHFVNGLCVLAH